ncbi:hypothetical protein Tsubulata_041567, partial [Turnera subulata]
MLCRSFVNETEDAKKYEPPSKASSEHFVCFVVLEKEVKAVAEALQSRFRFEGKLFES